MKHITRSGEFNPIAPFIGWLLVGWMASWQVVRQVHPGLINSARNISIGLGLLAPLYLVYKWACRGLLYRAAKIEMPSGAIGDIIEGDNGLYNIIELSQRVRTLKENVIDNSYDEYKNKDIKSLKQNEILSFLHYAIDESIEIDCRPLCPKSDETMACFFIMAVKDHQIKFDYNNTKVYHSVTFASFLAISLGCIQHKIAPSGLLQERLGHYTKEGQRAQLNGDVISDIMNIYNDLFVESIYKGNVKFS